MEVTSGAKGIHDLLLAVKPEGHEHPPCRWCVTDSDDPGGKPVDYTDEQVQAKVDEAVAAVRAELQVTIDELSAKVEKTAVDEAVADAVAPFKDQVADLQAQLDVKAAELAAVVAERDALTAEKTEKEEAEQRENALAALEEQRVADVKVAELKLDDKFVADNKRRWAEMTDDSWQTLVASMKAAAETVTPSPAPTPPSALTAALDEGRTTGSATRDLIGLRRSGVRVSNF